MKRRHATRAILLALGSPQLFLASAPTHAQGSPLVEGKNFRKVATPQPPPSDGKIEVLEFFSYACPHCSAFEPTLEAWARQLPPSVVLRRVPVPFLANAENFQRTYYALETMGLVDTLQRKIFAAVHVEQLRLNKPEDLAALVGKNGADATKFAAIFQSFSVAAALGRARKLTRDVALDGVPALVVQGRYVTSPQMAGGERQALAVVDELVRRVRKE